jgi:phenylpropionate dioxygenase-like ring-hydroxylating dioxygenase large terminal subunit
VGAAEMADTIGFSKEEHGLVPIRLETWGGFLFVNFDRNAQALAEYLGDLQEKLSPYGLEEMVLARRREYMMECNWKLFTENNKDSYHIATVHRTTINQVASTRAAGYAIEPARGQYCVTFAQHSGSMALLKGDAGFPVNERLAGRREAEGTYAPLIYPSTYLACTVDCAFYIELHPMGVTRSKLAVGVLFPRERLQRKDFEEIAQNYYKRLDLTIAEDIAASERQQRGLASPFARPGRFSRREALVHGIDNWILDRLFDG